MRLNTFALANTFAIIDVVLHSLFHIWISVNPDSYVWLANLFVAGLHLEVTQFDSSIQHIIFGTILEAFVFWLLGAVVALTYNKLSKVK